jgi:glycosyltransferase involved in cell wall biosynthesis
MTMHICRVTRAFIPLRDGISHHTFYLSKHQARLGHKVWVLQPHHPRGEVEGFRIEHIPLGPLTPKYGWESVTALFALLAGFKALFLYKQFGLDLIHVHGDVVEALVLKPFAWLMKVPLVMTMHSRLSLKRKYRMVAPSVWRMVDGVIAVSPDVARDLQALGVDPNRVSIISSGVELDCFAPPTSAARQVAKEALGIPREALVVAAVGNLNPMKGFRYLVEAMRSLSDVDNLQAYIIGDGPLRSELAALADGLPSVHLVGGVPHEQIQMYLYSSDLFVLPSIDLPGKAEGTPTAVMEAMAAGLPVITTDSGGAKYLIEAIPGVTLVPQRDSQALARAILKLAENAEFRKHLGQLNHQRVQERDWSHIAAVVCEVYKKAGVLSA